MRPSWVCGTFTTSALIGFFLAHSSFTYGVRLDEKLLLDIFPGEKEAQADPDELAELSLHSLGAETENVPPAVQAEVVPLQATQHNDIYLERVPKEDVRINFEIKTIGNLTAVSATMKGRRPTDEDAVTTLEQLTDNTYFLGLFDGHGGSETSEYLRENAHTEIAKAIKDQIDTPADIDEDKIAEACIDLDKKIVLNNICRDSGSTAAMLLVERDLLGDGVFRVHSIYVGDSRIAILNFDEAPIFMTEDHKPNKPEEAARIRAAGGEVYNVQGVWRVGGILAMSRAFGDPMFKDYSLRSPREQQVVAVPGQQVQSISSKSLILLACDGLFETVDADLEQVFRAALEESGGGIVSTIRKLLLTAYDRGSGDNISVIVGVMHPESAPPLSRRFVVDRGEAL